MEFGNFFTGNEWMVYFILGIYFLFPDPTGITNIFHDAFCSTRTSLIQSCQINSIIPSRLACECFCFCYGGLCHPHLTDTLCWGSSPDPVVFFLRSLPQTSRTDITLKGSLFCITTDLTALIAHYIWKSALLYLSTLKANFILKGRSFFCL